MTSFGREPSAETPACEYRDLGSETVLCEKTTPLENNSRRRARLSNTVENNRTIVFWEYDCDANWFGGVKRGHKREGTIKRYEQFPVGEPAAPAPPPHLHA
ncbi:hypothetical protein EVAR_98074_1 [Eumeta japonica]|uniref:Uncharacterized protein n=1 Tax=Eumeta variegata TaxID=151549 RepID=A0A4C1WDA4_EUMVA|nr:hypothetical protein EVAR_98074_1 [Eumeta japonica]